MTYLKLNNVSKSFGKRLILDNINISLPETGLVLFKGLNGSGKTTIFNIISKRISKEGEIIYPEGFSIKKDLYYGFSEDELYQNIKVKDKALLLLDKEEFTEFLNYTFKFNLKRFLRRKIKSLSSGERQQIDLCFSFAKKAKILLLDEPLEFIDREKKVLYIEEIKRLSEKKLILETCHYDIHEADIVVNMNPFSVNYNAKDRKNVNEIKASTKRHLMPIRGLIANYRFFNLFITLFILLLTAFSLSTSKIQEITDRDILKNVTEKNSLNPYYYYEYGLLPNSYYQQKIHVVKNQNLKNLRGEKRFSNIMDYRSYINGRNNIILEDYFEDGVIKKVRDNTVYISDYMYELLSLGKSLLEYEIDTRYTEGKQAYIIPEMSVDYSDTSFIIEDYGLEYNKKKYGICYDIIVYRTDFRKYMPRPSDVGKKNFEEIASLFASRVDKFYLNSFMNEYTFDTSSGAFHYFKDDEGGITLKVDEEKYIFYNDISFSIFNEEKNKLQDDEFMGGFYTIKEISGLPANHPAFASEEAMENYFKDKEFEFDFNGMKKTLKFKSLPRYDNGNVAATGICVSKKNFYDIGIQIGIGKSEYYRATSPSIDMINIDDIDNLDLVDFMGKDTYIHNIDNKNVFINNSKYVFITIGLSYAIALLIYFKLKLIPEFKSLRLLKVKGYSGSEIFITNYLIRTIFLIISIALGIALGFILVNPLAKVLGILV